MTIKEFDKVLLKSGEEAYIADILKAGVAYVVDIDKADGTVETEIIEEKNISTILKGALISRRRELFQNL